MEYPETFGTFEQTMRGVPVTVDYQYISPEKGGPDGQVLAVYLPGYPEIDVKDCLDYDTLSCFESNAIWHDHHDRGEALDNNHLITDAELVSILGLMYLDAQDKESVTMIHLFGIRHAEDIKKSGSSVTKIVKMSSIPNSYVTEVHKGMRLAKFVAPLGSVRDTLGSSKPIRTPINA